MSPKLIRQVSCIPCTPRKAYQTTVWQALRAAQGLPDKCFAYLARRARLIRQVFCIPCTPRKVYQTTVLYTLRATQDLPDKCFVYLARRARLARQLSRIPCAPRKVCKTRKLGSFQKAKSRRTFLRLFALYIHQEHIPIYTLSLQNVRIQHPPIGSLSDKILSFL